MAVGDNARAAFLASSWHWMQIIKQRPGGCQGIFQGRTGFRCERRAAVGWASASAAAVVGGALGSGGLSRGPCGGAVAGEVLRRGVCGGPARGAAGEAPRLLHEIVLYTYQ